MIRKLQSGLKALAITFAVSGVAAAEDVGAAANNPQSKSDGNWVSISGIVASASDESFVLDYGTDTITVEMGDWKWYNDSKALLEGDDVIVYGRIDDNFYSDKSIEAHSVYVKQFNTFFLTDDAKNNLTTLINFSPVPAGRASMDLTGRVTNVDGRQFTLDAGSRQIRVDTSHMAYNPMDDHGYQKIKKGDRVKVFAETDELVKTKQVTAASIVSLLPEVRKLTYDR